jgi:hypothetical protein
MDGSPGERDPVLMPEQPIRRILLVPAPEPKAGARAARPGVRRFALARPSVALGPELLRPQTTAPLAGVRAP